MPPVGEEHGQRALDLGSELRRFVRIHGLGIAGVEIGFRLSESPATVLAPDIAFVSNDMLDAGRDTRRFVDGPPTLAVEIMSPDDREQEVSAKVSRYLTAGAHRVWVVRPTSRTITVHRPGGDAHTYTIDDTLTSEDAGLSVDGFALPLRVAFGDP
jgi:Uma2 family endonuclease